MNKQTNPFAPLPVPRTTSCKCCGAACSLVAVMDSSRGGVNARAGWSIDDFSGYAVYYYRCATCGFTFTRAFDHWTLADFSKNIYNEDYNRQDPDYITGERGTRTAEHIIQQFGAYAQQLSVLDWGSGEGSFAARLEQHGFTQVDGYDPFVETVKSLPSGNYDMVTCFEVIEHVLDPVSLVKDLAACRSPQGAILISTLCCTQQVINFGLENWHYCVPKNGHISLMTPQALAHCAHKAGLVAYSFTEAAHALFDATNIPVWLAGVLPNAAP